jgi:hypothetical protein
MKNCLIFAALPLMLLGACSESEEAEPVEAAPEVDLAAGTGPFLVTWPDGTRALNFATADGVQYGGPIEGEPGTWTVDGDNACVDPAGDAEPVCWTNAEPAADGTFTFTRTDGTASGLITPLVEAVEGQGGAWTVANADGTMSLAVWTADGKAYLAPVAQTGSWRAADGQRCGRMGDAEEETCGTPGEMGADGTFTSTNANGDTLTVQMLD